MFYFLIFEVKFGIVPPFALELIIDWSGEHHVSYVDIICFGLGCIVSLLTYYCFLIEVSMVAGDILSL